MTDGRFVPGADHPDPPGPTDLALLVAGRKLLTTGDPVPPAEGAPPPAADRPPLVREDATPPGGAAGPDAGRPPHPFPRIADLPASTAWVPLGRLDDVPVWGAELPEPDERLGRWRSWPSIAARVPEPLAALAGRALQVITWRRSHRYCGACTVELTDVPGEAARRCPGCQLYVPMQLSPAVLVAIGRADPLGGTDELLLVRHSYGPTELWALVAGFVEAGESLEAAAHREVGEEVGLTIDQLTYHGSQPWAMSGPGVLLAGFHARSAVPDAEPVVDGREIVQARWFGLDALPAELPPSYSISRWLIDAAVHAATTGG